MIILKKKIETLQTKAIGLNKSFLCRSVSSKLRTFQRLVGKSWPWGLAPLRVPGTREDGRGGVSRLGCRLAPGFRAPQREIPGSLLHTCLLTAV